MSRSHARLNDRSRLQSLHQEMQREHMVYTHTAVIGQPLFLISPKCEEFWHMSRELSSAPMIMAPHALRWLRQILFDYVTLLMGRAHSHLYFHGGTHCLHTSTSSLFSRTVKWHSPKEHPESLEGHCVGC